MAKTVVGLFDDFGDAQNVTQELIDHGFRREDISLIANQDAAGRERMVGDDRDQGNKAGDYAGSGAVGGTLLGGAIGLLVGAGLIAIPGIGPVLAAGPLAAAVGTGTAMAGAGALGAGIGAAAGGLIGGLVGAGVPEEQAGYYAEGVRRGGTLVAVTTDDAMATTAYDIMNRHNVVDIEDRAAQWRSSGWNGTFDPNGRSEIRSDRSEVRTEPGYKPDLSTAATHTSVDNAMPVVEEELHVDKRRVDKGGVQVSSHVEKHPVEENVNLREERVNVERRPVDRPLTDADAAAFKETSFEVRESVEEPVVRKRARVVEEVIIDQDSTSHTETVRDNVRRTDVNVERTTPGKMSHTGTASSSSFDTYDKDYRDHYQRNYASTGYTYDDYTPVYRYGYALATDDRYAGSDWKTIEPEARRRWETHNPNSWDEFKDSIRYAWDRARGRR